MGGRLLGRRQSGEHASAGGEENRLYPWGNAVPDATKDSFNCMFDGVGSCAMSTDLNHLGLLPGGQGRWGHQGLGGGVSEWVLDSYDWDWYQSGGAPWSGLRTTGPV